MKNQINISIILLYLLKLYYSKIKYKNNSIVMKKNKLLLIYFLLININNALSLLSLQKYIFFLNNRSRLINNRKLPMISAILCFLLSINYLLYKKHIKKILKIMIKY
jgi:hypothetical protein